MMRELVVVMIEMSLPLQHLIPTTFNFFGKMPFFLLFSSMK